MTLTCTITARCTRLGATLATKKWTGVDIMKTGYTRGWCTRQLRLHPLDHTAVWWDCRYDQPSAGQAGGFRHHFDGSIVRIQGSLLRRGIFE